LPSALRTVTEEALLLRAMPLLERETLPLERDALEPEGRDGVT